LLVKKSPSQKKKENKQTNLNKSPVSPREGFLSTRTCVLEAGKWSTDYTLGSPAPEGRVFPVTRNTTNKIAFSIIFNFLRGSFVKSSRSLKLECTLKLNPCYFALQAKR